MFQSLLEVDAEAFDAQGPFMLRGLSICLNQSRKHLQYVTGRFGLGAANHLVLLPAPTAARAAQYGV